MTSTTLDPERLVPDQLTVLTTSECNARCAHCLVRSGPDRKDTLDRDQLLATIDRVHDNYPLSVVVFAGGEPTLLGDTLLEAIAQASCLGIGTRLVTNGWWAPTVAEGRAMIARLREAGLDELNVSADDFHLPFLDLSVVVNSWHAAKGAGFRSVVIALSSGPGSKVTPERMMAALGEEVPLIYDDLGEMLPLPPPSADGTRYVLANNLIYRIGRGRHLKEKYVVYPRSPVDLDRPCPWAIRSATVSPKHHLVACCGIEAEDNEVLDFGSLDEVDLTELIARANADPLVMGISVLGPMRMMELAQQADPTLVFRPRYTAICEICEDVTTNQAAVTALRRRPEVLWGEITAAKVVRMLAVPG